MFFLVTTLDHTPQSLPTTNTTITTTTTTTHDQSNPSSSTLEGNGAAAAAAASAAAAAINGHGNGHGHGNGFDHPPPSYDLVQNGKSRKQHQQRCSLQTLLPASAQQQFKAGKHKHKQLKQQHHHHHHHQQQLKQQLVAAELQMQHQQQEGCGPSSPSLLPRSPATSSSYRLNLKRSLHLPLTPSYDDERHSPLPLLHHHVQHSQQTTAIGSVAAAAAAVASVASGAGTGGSGTSSSTTAPTSVSASLATAAPPPPLAPRRPSTLQLQASSGVISASNTTLTTIHTTAPQPPAPADYKYYSPQRSQDSMFMRSFPLAKGTRGMRRQSTQSVDSQKVNIAGYQPLPMRKPYKHQEVMFELKSPTNRLTIRECDFGGGGEPCDDDQSIKDSQIFRVSKRNLYMNHRSPWKERDRYSNLYEYSFNIDLNSIIEDAAGSDSS